LNNTHRAVVAEDPRLTPWGATDSLRGSFGRNYWCHATFSNPGKTFRESKY
jgi:hypothetical protein